MGLPTSGPLSFSDIYTELYGTHNSQLCSLGDMSDDAGFTDPDKVSDFYGYTSEGFTVTPTVFNDVSWKGETKSFSIDSTSVNWSISSVSWITSINPDSGGDGNQNVTFYVTGNNDTVNSRNDTQALTITTDSTEVGTIYIEVNQHKKYYFSKSGDFVINYAANSSDNVTITTNVSSWGANINNYGDFATNEISVSKSGTTLTVTISTENSGSSNKTATVKVYDNGSDPADPIYIDVTQTTNISLSASPTVFTGVSWRGENLTTNVVSSNVNWTSNKVSWITNVNPSSGGDGSTSVTISVASYTDTTTNRHDTAAVSFKDSGGTVSDVDIDITQNYKRYITVTNDTIEWNITSHSVTVGGNVGSTWDVNSYTGNITNASKNNNTTLSITISQNTDTTNSANSSVILKDTGTDPADSVTYTVTQTKKYYINPGFDKTDISWRQDSTVTFTVESNIAWKVKSYSGNIKSNGISPTSGSAGNTSVTVTFNENTSTTNTYQSTIIFEDNDTSHYATDESINLIQNVKRSFELDPETINQTDPYGDGGYVELINSNIGNDWTYTILENTNDFATVSVDDANSPGENQLYYEHNDNDTYDTLTLRVEISDTGASNPNDAADPKTFTLTVPPKEVDITVEDPIIDYSYTDWENVTVTTDSEVSWTAAVKSGSENTIEVDSTNNSGTGTGYFKVKFLNQNTDKNNTVVAYVDITGTVNNQSKTITSTVTHDKAEYIIIVQIDLQSMFSGTSYDYFLTNADCVSGTNPKYWNIRAYNYDGNGNPVLFDRSSIENEHVEKGASSYIEVSLDVTDHVTFNSTTVIIETVVYYDDGSVNNCSNGELVYDAYDDNDTLLSTRHSEDCRIVINNVETDTSSDVVQTSFTYDTLDTVVYFQIKGDDAYCVCN